MKRIERHIFLLLAILAVGLSGLCYWFLEQNAPSATDEQYVSSVQQRVKEEMRISAADLQNVVGQVKQVASPTFADLSYPTQYPYFVFRYRPGGAQLLYWSDYRFIPDYARIASVTSPQLVDFEQGRYIVSRQQILTKSDTLEIFSLVNLYRHYQNNNTYLQSGYNPALFTLDPEAVTNARTNVHQAIYDNSSAFLFSVIPPKVDAYRNHSTPVNTVILASLGVVFLGLYVFQMMIHLKRRRKYELGFVWLAAYLVLLRALMLYFGVPFLFIESDLFNPKFYASSVLVPSLGDLLLNALVVLGLAFYWVNHYYRSQTYNRLLHWPAWAKTLLSLGCVLMSYVVFFFCYTELNNIYDKSQFTLDITLNIRFSLLKIVCLLVFIVISSVYFLLTHLLASLFLRFNRTLSTGVGWMIIGSGLTVGWFLLIGWPLEPVLFLNALYILLIYLGQFPRSLYTFRYKTSIYLFLAAFICAVTSAYVVYNQEIRKQLIHEREFGAQLLAENDEFGEFLMSKARESIASDADIVRALRTDTLLVRERIQQRVKTVHLDKYFDKYDIDVVSFRSNGQPLDIMANASTLDRFNNRYRRPAYQTNYPGLYFVNEVGNQFIKQYVSFIPIRSMGVPATAADTLGYVVLDFRLRSERPKSVYPELLVDTKFMQNTDVQEYSYAIFGRVRLADTVSHQLLYSAGSYNYERKMPTTLLADSTLYSTGLIANGYQHVGQSGKNGRVVVVSSAEYPFQNIFSNFSFLFLLLVLTVLLVIVAYAINYGFSEFSINYSTRIQILLNVAFFLPLLLVIIIILSVISSNYITNQENTYISNTRNIAANFLTYLDEHLQAKKRSKASMEEELSKIARDANIDINLFDTQGRLYSSTRPLMYESGYLSKYINPEAYLHLIEDKENQVLLNESLGSKRYRTAYASIKSYDGRLLGILSVPYFYARPELDRQIIEVIASALSIFTGLFLFFLILSYFASNILTKPLKLLTQKIRKTNLDQPNEPLPWRSDDEIGMLIREYNRMLVKLEESKQALAQNEKQSAWREMAKQVAHEIKNPLTPMKLTLQHLQRTFPGSRGAVGASAPGESATHRVIQRTFDSLLDQIDNLSDIATSFSDFAKMPLPKNEVFEVTSVINKAADLYADDDRISLRRQIATGPIMAIGDRQLIGRILTNLIINAVQSVPSDRKPVLNLRLYTKEDEVQIEVHDNGTGIPEAIRTKVFLPNFSTKRGGSGLGLAIAKRGIEHAGGSIWFETTEHVGTSFFVSLPLAGVPIEKAADSVR
ncbi:HAMP domain-containing histidine kinase [Spirosoma taeanense]|uniref:histidine kinase n=1 Tax=Spirosoma taeanense TaxID=2735870 RepID=A0A6M5Y6J8_9BACT|nr:HAMP domain-containing sensor histidine kinase [Spirosoma taeanense]QJW88980.1 HAMP domain-containing histidine kinase [Spirosoma taeanense]